MNIFKSKKDKKLLNMKGKYKLKKVLPVILLLLLITIVIGVTYAMYIITLNSSENSITTGLVSMSYTESTNVIAIENALPTSDSLGKTSSNYFDFSITSNLTLNENNPNTDVNYSIEIEPLSTNTLQDNQIKLYLEDTTNNKVIIDSRLISNITNYTLYNTKHTHIYNLNTITTNYRLIAWIDYNVDSSNWSNTNQYEYKFKINVNGDINALVAPTPEYCFKTSGSTITGYNCDSGNTYGYETITDVVIPSTINGVTITEIYDNAFYSKGLTSVDIPDIVTYLGEDTFGSNNLKVLKIPSSITKIDTAGGASSPCRNCTIEKVVFKGNWTTIHSNLFKNTTLSSDFTIPDGVTTIGNYAFFNAHLTNIAIPSNVTTIEFSAFQNNNLTEVTIPNNVTSIGFSAFAWNKLTSVKIKGKSSSSDFTSYGSNIWGWATGYSDSDIIWNYTE